MRQWLLHVGLYNNSPYELFFVMSTVLFTYSSLSIFSQKSCLLFTSTDYQLPYVIYVYQFLQRHQRLMKHDQNAWWDIMSSLQKMLRKAARVLHSAGKISYESMHNYFMSGLSSLTSVHSTVRTGYARICSRVYYAGLSRPI